MNYIIIGLLLTSQFNTGKVHPQLAEKLALMKQNEQIEIIVHMKNHPDLSLMGESASKAEKILYLQEFARTDQTAILSYLNMHTEEISELKSYWIFNGLSFQATRKVIEIVASRGDVDYVIDNFIIPLPKEKTSTKGDPETIEWNILKVKAPDCWSVGFDGSGIIVGNIDTGVDVTHPALAGKWIAGGWLDAVNGETTPYDDVGHGTHVMGTICGGDGYGSFPYDIGVAPGAQFICAKAFTADYGYAIWIHNCFQWLATQDVDVINNSWGNDNPADLEYWNDCRNLHDLNIYPVFCIGNYPSGPINAETPGNFPTVTGVGATDSNDDIASFSCLGPAPNQDPWNDPEHWKRPDWNRIKPDISAPGVDINSCVPGGEYESKDGTSMACPHVAGAVAICLQMKPDINYSTLYTDLLDKADRPSQGLPYPNNDYGWGRLNCYSVLEYITSVQPDNQVKPWWGTFYIGDDTYNSSGSGQNVLQFANPHQWATHHVKIENDGEDKDIIYVKATTEGTGTWTVRYYDALSGGNDITSQITSGNGWITIVPSEGFREIRVEVRPGSNMQGLVKRVKIMSTTYGKNGTKTDLVFMDTQCNILQPDMHIKNDNESSYVGNNIYNTSGTNQTKYQEVTFQETAVYHLKLENDGETWDIDWIDGPGSDNDWTIEYWDALAGGSNITSEVVNGTYWIYLPGPGAAEYLRVEVTPTMSAPQGQIKDVPVKATAGYNAHKKDVVKARTKCTLHKIDPIDGPQESDSHIAQEFTIISITPNPVEDVLTLEYISPDERTLSVTLYDITGRMVKRLFYGRAKIGVNKISYSGENLSSGVYFLRLETEEKRLTEKILIQR
jgi:subtilisin family serine protease